MNRYSYNPPERQPVKKTTWWRNFLHRLNPWRTVYLSTPTPPQWVPIGECDLLMQNFEWVTLMYNFGGKVQIQSLCAELLTRKMLEDAAYWCPLPIPPR